MFKMLARIAEKHIYITTAVLSVLISSWLFVSGDIISRDSLLYVQVANAFLNDGVAGAFNVWGWQYYPYA